MERRNIKLPQGGLLELEIRPGFYDKVRQQLGLEQGEAVSDDHVRMFVFGAVKGAIDKAEAS